MKIVFLDAATTSNGDLSLDPIASYGDFVAYEHTKDEDIVERAGEAEILITNKCEIGKNIISALPKLKLICVAATGYNNIDLPAANANGVIVANVSGYSTQSVNQHVFALLLSYLNNPMYYSHGVKLNRWAESRDFSYTDKPIGNIAGKTMGIIGYGTIGKHVARTALSLGMEILAVNRSGTEPDTPGVRLVDIETLLSQSDVISLHASGNPSTKHIINKDTLSKLKATAILINTSRGMLIDEDALYKWLANNKQAAALLDVLTNEPPRAYHPLYGLANCIITPHQAWIGTDARKRLIDGIANNIKSYLSGSLEGIAI